MSASISSPAPPSPRGYRFNRDEFHQMWDFGWFADRYVELIEGEIVEMPHPGTAHCVSTDRSTEALRAVFGKGYWVRMQMPLNLSPFSEPLPDVAVVEGDRDSNLPTPTMAILGVEVSDTTLAYDRGKKASLYARAGLADYWIVNLLDKQLEIRRRPIPDDTREFGFAYADVTILKPGDFATPLAAPQARIAVADLLPK